MSHLFHADSLLVRILNRIADLVLLNLVFLVTCLPLFTIGASVTALYTVLLQIVRKEDRSLFGSYFSAWKSNFWQATALWGIELGAWGLIWSIRQVCTQLPGPGQAAALLMLTVLSLAVGISTMFVFPVLSRFKGSVRQILMNSLLIPLSNLSSTLVAGGVIAGPVFLSAWSARFFLVWFYLLALGGIAFAAYGSAFFINRLFMPFEASCLSKEE